MAVRAAGLIFVLDHNLGVHMLEVLRKAMIWPDEQLTSLAEMGYAGGLPDEEWITHLGKRGGHVAITRDGNILNAAIRREAWRSSGLGLIILDKKWGMLPRREWARHILYWWPAMTQRALEGEPGAAWTVAPRIAEPPDFWIRKVTGRGPPS